MNQELLNEVGTLFHIKTEIATNHPGFDAVGRACHKRLQEIEAEFKMAEQAEAAPRVVSQAELKAAQHTTGQLSLKKQYEDETVKEHGNPEVPNVDRRV